MTEGERTRLVAWAHEMRAVHVRLREALAVTQAAAEAGTAPGVSTREVLLWCRGFCTALTGHHDGEDRHLFPAIAAEHPELGEVLRKLTQDHSMMSHLITALEDAVGRRADVEELHRHLEGLAAIMESHFRFEERALLRVLETLHLDVDPADAFGPL